MIVSKWMTVSSTGAAKLFSRKPGLGHDEIAVQIELTIPDSIFEKPTFKAVLQFQEGELSDIADIDLSVVSSAIQDATGFNVRVIAPEVEG